MTRYFAVRFAPHPKQGTMPEAPHPWEWRPWIHSTAEDMDRLVLHRAVRNRGGISEATDVTLFETTPPGRRPEPPTGVRFVNFTLHFTLHPK